MVLHNKLSTRVTGERSVHLYQNENQVLSIPMRLVDRLQSYQLFIDSPPTRRSSPKLSTFIDRPRLVDIARPFVALEAIDESRVVS